MRRRKWKSIDGKKFEMFRFAVSFVIYAVIVLMLLQLVLGISFVDGESMVPTLKNGQVAVYWRLDSKYETGDIVSVRLPSGDYYVKRVVAVGGDTVDIRGGALYVNGIQEQGAYVNGRTDTQDSYFTYPLRLEEGQYFVVGDNRGVSMDSRTFGPVISSQIRGRILFWFG